MHQLVLLKRNKYSDFKYENFWMLNVKIADLFDVTLYSFTHMCLMPAKLVRCSVNNFTSIAYDFVLCNMYLFDYTTKMDRLQTMFRGPCLIFLFYLPLFTFPVYHLFPMSVAYPDLSLCKAGHSHV